MGEIEVEYQRRLFSLGPNLSKAAFEASFLSNRNKKGIFTQEYFQIIVQVFCKRRGFFSELNIFYEFFIKHKHDMMVFSNNAI